MASYTGATPIEPPARGEVVAYDVLWPGTGGETVDPKRYIRVAGEWVPIQ